MVIWLNNNPSKRKKNYRRFISNWLTRANDGALSKPQRKAVKMPDKYERAFMTARERNMTIEALIDLDPFYKSIFEGVNLEEAKARYA
jgi:vacuolar-type H+-ATPase subunit B/Vma2